MATGNKFNPFIANLYNAYLSGQTIKAYLSNELPLATDGVKADIAEIAAGNGYTAGGVTIAVTSSTQTGGTYSLVTGGATITATGAVPTFNYVIFYISTLAGEPLMQWYQTTTPITMSSGDTFTIDITTLRSAT